INDGDNAVVVLDKTSFYAESGGQIGDCGVIRIGESVFEVTKTTKDPDGAYLHQGTLVGDGIKVGDKAVTVYNEEVREATKRNHTAAHLLQAALREILGSHVEQAGQLVNDSAMRFDFTHFSALTSEELAAVENKVNEVILSACAVSSTEMPIEEAKKMGAMALFGEKYGDVVRVVKAGEFSTELCGGTHVDNAGKLGLFKIVSESSVASGVRRIEAVTGKGVVEYIASLNSLIANTAKAMKLGNVNELERKAVAMAAELKEKEREIAALSAQLTDLKSADIFSAPEQIGAVKLIIARAEDMSADDIRSLGDKAKEQGDDVVAVIACVNNEKGSANIAVACGKAAVAAGANAGAIVRAVAQLAGGNGGGKPDFAMAGAKDLSKLDDAVAAASGIVSGMLK
ncbi:MAG: DHHA1 domain-containing protein, partial [Acutalibacteraceae bacterium]|nr:DHHA1 domain-containing protein [Acutalibacteraceae bacterium]